MTTLLKKDTLPKEEMRNVADKIVAEIHTKYLTQTTNAAGTAMTVAPTNSDFQNMNAKTALPAIKAILIPLVSLVS